MDLRDFLAFLCVIMVRPGYPPWVGSENTVWGSTMYEHRMQLVGNGTRNNAAARRRVHAARRRTARMRARIAESQAAPPGDGAQAAG